MNEEYLGDSYDLVKRFFSSTLNPIAKLYADPKFVPDGIRENYATLTKIQIYGERPKDPFGILLDPDTGICLPGQKPNTSKHVSLECIVDLNHKQRPDYIICFDQSHYRKHELNREEQRDKKMKFRRESGLSSFYYKSHAPFLFTAQDANILGSILERLKRAGIPDDRFQLPKAV